MTKKHVNLGASGIGKAEPIPARPRDFYIYVFLFLATLIVYSRVYHFEFLSFDDSEYVALNPHVHAGLTWEGLKWALTTNRDGNWFPLTWISHLLDWQLFGARSGLHHLTSVLIHLCSTLLLFALLKRMTGARWRSAVVAFLFALHPLHVESVAWVAERKDVLCGLFWFLTLWSYLRYVERPKPGRYLLVLVPFCLGLMSKPMIITIPFVMLLLDIWPLRRIQLSSIPVPDRSKQKAGLQKSTRPPIRHILWEKAPLFVLSGISAFVTYVVQQGGGAVMPVDWIPLGTRMGNALISYLAYLAQMFWPVRLAAFYPYPLTLPGWQVMAAGFALLLISLLALLLIRRFPFVAVGWFWYLGTLVPVIGLVQVGMQARADRYTYIPLVGIFILLTWGAAEVLRHVRKPQFPLAGLASAVCLGCLLTTWHQVAYWRDTFSLFQHAIEVTDGNYIGYCALAGALRNQGRMEEAVSAYKEAIRLFPRYGVAYGGLGAVFLSQGRLDEAVSRLAEAVRLNPESPEDLINLGIALDKTGKPEEAIRQLLDAIRVEPDSVEAHYNLGRVYASAGKMEDAVAQFSIAAQLQPEGPEVHYNLGNALASEGKMAEAVAEFSKAVQLRPDYASAHNNLGSALADLGRIDEAIAQFSEAVRLAPDSAEAKRNLEYALALKK